MKDEKFDIIINSLQDRVDLCRKYLDGIQHKQDLLNLKLSDVIELKKFCVTEKEKMTKILMVDLYHIIGMGDLTCSQTSKFISLIKQYSNYRADIKTLAESLDSIHELPSIPTGARFNLLELGKVTLIKQSRGDNDDIIDDNDNVESYTSIHYADTDFKTFKVDAKLTKIYVDLNTTTIEEFILEITSKLIMSKLNSENLLSAINNNRQYGGGKWSKMDNIATCDIESNSVRNALRNAIRRGK